MDFVNSEKLATLRHTFDLNYKLSHLYASYLQLCPELISKKMVDEVTSGTDITKKEALVALLSEIFGLDDGRGGDDRTLIRKYLSRSVTLLNAKKYTENPYYKNIKIDKISDGEWEFKWESYPPYRAAISGDMIKEDDFTEYAPLGFFDEEFSFLAVLENGNEWMTLTPVDLDTSEDAIERARGKVVTFGLGLGYFAYMASEKENVSQVTVVERSEKVANLFKRHILPQFKNGHKINIVISDAFDYAKDVMPEEHFDFAFVDTWRDASDGAPMYKRMKALEGLSPETEFSYWIENFLVSRLRAEKFEELYSLTQSNSPDAPADYKEFISRL